MTAIEWLSSITGFFRWMFFSSFLNLILLVMGEANEVPFNSAISACEKCSEWTWSLHILQQMEESGVHFIQQIKTSSYLVDICVASTNLASVLSYQRLYLIRWFSFKRFYFYYFCWYLMYSLESNFHVCWSPVVAPQHTASTPRQFQFQGLADKITLSAAIRACNRCPALRMTGVCKSDAQLWSSTAYPTWVY